MQSSYNVTVDRLSTLEGKLESLIEENTLLKTQVKGSASDSTIAAIQDLENRLSEISKENASLREEVEKVKSSTENIALTVANTDVGGAEDGIISVEEAEENADLELARKEVMDAIGRKVDAAKEEDKNDLSAIRGVGAFIEQKLNGLGIYTYKQVSQFDKPFIEKLTTAIEFFPGRIERDDWVGQATRLMEIEAENPKSLKKSIYPDNNQDLKIVEGIGPKIEVILKKAKITTWDDLAKADVDKIREILAAAGSRFKMHDPTTWPTQAPLAVDWKWTELKEYQDYLSGGKEK